MHIFCINHTWVDMIMSTGYETKNLPQSNIVPQKNENGNLHGVKTPIQPKPSLFMRKYDPVGDNNERGKSRMCIPLIRVINYTGRAASRQSGYLLFSFCFFTLHLLWPLKRD